MQGPEWNESGLLLETWSLDAKDSRVCAYFSFKHTQMQSTLVNTLEKPLEPEPLGESASSQQAFRAFPINQRVNHADFVFSFCQQSALSITGTTGCKCSFCISISILERGLEVSVHSLVFTVCRQPQVSELETARSTME